MKQLIQNLKTGELRLKDVPVPLCKSNGVLVKTICSLVSIGTERSIIELAKKSLIGKAKARPDLFKRAIEKARKEGFLKVYKEAKERLDEPFPLGYSASGIVVEVGKGISDFYVGMPVAICGGGFANHAEYNFVPKNLCVPLPKKNNGNYISFEEGAFCMLGSIALHGIREAGITPGETVLVIGLGLLGLLTMQIIRAMGSFVIGIDIDTKKIEFARQLGEKYLFNNKKDGLDEFIYSITGNEGVDATIITAATDNNEPIEIAQNFTRRRGRIELVGVTKINLDRKSFWEKELSFSVSRADGPGMFDEKYIIKGIDYPQEYVRWTKRRNVEYFLKLIAQDKIKIEPLITHRYSFYKAEEVYKRILEGKEAVVGVLFDFSSNNYNVNFDKLKIQGYSNLDSNDSKEIVIGLIGGGMFAKSILLPEIKGLSHVKLKTVATTRGMTAGHIAEKYGFHQVTTDYRNILNDSEINTVIIVTQHDSHAKFVKEALEAKKDVFVEKPLCLNEEELREIIKIKEKYKKNILMVGYNRRFSPHVADIKKFFSDEQYRPKIINYRVNAGFIPREHWTQDYKKGGGRIIGEVCHFVDLCIYLTESMPCLVYAQGISDSIKYLVDDNIIVNIKFNDGSLASIIYTSMGDKGCERETIEIFSGNSVYYLKDFRVAIKYRNGKKRKKKLFTKDIGHKHEMKLFLSKDLKDLIKFEDVIIGMLTTFYILESLKTGKPINIRDKYNEFIKSL